MYYYADGGDGDDESALDSSAALDSSDDAVTSFAHTPGRQHLRAWRQQRALAMSSSNGNSSQSGHGDDVKLVYVSGLPKAFSQQDVRDLLVGVTLLSIQIN